ncbi:BRASSINOSTEROID INSENSITIVE 1-associated receptor kinase 1 precursor, putative [Ricinus communis]|uniref:BRASSINOSTEROID INSENSITIVE 1-associated receptor kinase 1, putative n=2 Tax=Ricinus communis TaxID=3988 RepID=B9R7M3_RICCO|nr:BRASSINOSTEROID INSENSITIVE 1-associated receptor kinase 1 precursor, putative [Ricinus communis]
MFPAKNEPRVSQRAAYTGADRVVVAVKAEKVISKTALAWALTHVVHPGDCITLLAVFSKTKTGKRFWSFPKLTGDCGSSHRDKFSDRICEISESCSQMVLQLHNQVEVGVRIKVVSGTSGNAVAAEAKQNGANWVVLDKKLKQELRHCIEELRCNIVVMKGSQAKVLRLNLGCSDEVQTPYYSAASSPEKNIGHRMKHSTPASSPEESSTSYSRTREDSLSSYDSTTPLFIYEQNPLFEGMNKGKQVPVDYQNDFDDSLIPPYSEDKVITLSKNSTSAGATNHNSVFWIPQNHIIDKNSLATQNRDCTNTSNNGSKASRTLLDKFVQYDQAARAGRNELSQSLQKDYTPSSNIKHAVSLGRTSSMPPPLCSLCQHKAPVFGKPPRQFSYKDLEEATEEFSDMNFLAEGGFGNVYRGVLRDGQVVAVKRLKSGGSQADADFCREVRVLSCAQHRNVVLLIGFCIDGKNRILVYEYICNGSLDFHLHGNRRMPLDWHSRMKIAIGTARGLRYLHEDCRVGCIVHRDMRPNNILVTHDFEPLVADFGLARWHSEWNMSTEERVIGTIGYLAPEYVNNGKITQKVDVYAFGVVLLELMTGQRINELQFYEGQQFLSDWFHPLAALEPGHVLTRIYQLLDPSLATEQVCDFAHQLQAMGQAASLCLRPDPESRPAMSKVLRILEGGDLIVPLCLDLSSAGNRSGHLRGLSLHREDKMMRSHSRKLSH